MNGVIEKLLEILLTARGSLAAGILVVGSTGVVITGVVGPGNDIALAVLAPVASASPSPRPSPTQAAPTTPPAGCAAALAVRSETLQALQEERVRALGDLRTIRRTAAELASAGRRDLGERALESAERELAAQVEQKLDGAKAALRDLADLTPCESNDPGQGAYFDLADLRERYRLVVEQLRRELRGLLVQAGQRFDALLKDAKPVPPPAPSSASGGSDDSDD